MLNHVAYVIVGRIQSIAFKNEETVKFCIGGDRGEGGAEGL